MLNYIGDNRCHNKYARLHLVCIRTDMHSKHPGAISVDILSNIYAPLGTSPFWSLNLYRIMHKGFIGFFLLLQVFPSSIDLQQSVYLDESWNVCFKQAEQTWMLTDIGSQYCDFQNKGQMGAGLMEQSF